MGPARTALPTGGLWAGGAGCDQASASASAAAMAPGLAFARDARIASASGAHAIVPTASHTDDGSECPAADISAAQPSAAKVQSFISTLR